MSEPDAHKYIGKQAMDRCVTRRAVAEEIIKTYIEKAGAFFRTRRLFVILMILPAFVSALSARRL
ncbi:MAG: ANTAR domain-containing protein [Clostridia bacterium]|nr:ANTAR domain-containing protein [Clostridia bacterium]